LIAYSPPSRQLSQIAGRASTHCHEPCNSRPCPLLGWARHYHMSSGPKPRLPTKVGPDAATCPMAPDLVLPAKVGSGAAMCPMTSDLASWLRWAPVLPRVLWLRTVPPSQGGSRCCHMSHGSQWAMGLRYIKKGLVGLSMRLGLHVSRA
jgi:hypothetical protein